MTDSFRGIIRRFLLWVRPCTHEWRYHPDNQSRICLACGEHQTIWDVRRG